jgi:CTP synthase
MSVAKLREIGIFPDALICRVDRPLGDFGPSIRKKLSMFCNVEENAVIEEADVKHSIYELPSELKKEGLDSLVLNRLGLNRRSGDHSRWEEIVRRIKSPKSSVRVAVVGKYMEIQDAYKSVFEALAHAAIAHDAKLELVKVDSEDIEAEGAEKILAGVDGIVVPGGFGNRGSRESSPRPSTHAKIKSPTSGSVWGSKSPRLSSREMSWG